MSKNDSETNSQVVQRLLHRSRSPTMKLGCAILTALIVLSIVAVSVMVKFATDIAVEERIRAQYPDSKVQRIPKKMGIISISDNASFAAAMNFPFVAAITRNISTSWTVSCFGSVILMKWIVTSAHCRIPGAIHRVLLMYDFSRNYTNTYTILFWKLHDKFDKQEPKKYDIAVAKMNVDVVPFMVKPSIFDDSSVSTFEVSIWKTVASMNMRIFLTNDVEVRNMVVADKLKCADYYGIAMDESVICVDMSQYEDCFVHEFGPLFSGIKAVGVLSLKPGDCDTKVSVFTNVSYYSLWILKATYSANL